MSRSPNVLIQWEKQVSEILLYWRRKSFNWKIKPFEVICIMLKTDEYNYIVIPVLMFQWHLLSSTKVQVRACINIHTQDSLDGIFLNQQIFIRLENVLEFIANHFFNNFLTTETPREILQILLIFPISSQTSGSYFGMKCDHLCGNISSSCTTKKIQVGPHIFIVKGSI